MLRGKAEEAGWQKAQAPGRLKALAFALSLPFISSAAAHASMAKRAQPVAAEPLSERITFIADGNCVKEGRVEFDTPQGMMIYPLRGNLDGEVICEKRRAFIMKGDELVVIIPSDEKDGTDIGQIGVEKIINIGKIRKKGIEAWFRSEDSVLFITRDRMLTRIPLEGKSQFDVRLPVETKGSRSAFHSGVLFVMPKGGSLMVMTFDDGAKWDYLPVKEDGSDFTVRNGVLHYGKGENEVQFWIEKTKNNRSISVMK